MLAPDRIEANQEEPIKLLEVTLATPKSGIMPVYFTPHVPSGIHYPSVIVEVHPDEFQDIKRKKLSLPDGWKIGPEFTRPSLAASA